MTRRAEWPALTWQASEAPAASRAAASDHCAGSGRDVPVGQRSPCPTRPTRSRRCERVESDRTVGHPGFVGTVHVVPPPRRVLSLIAAVAVALGLCVACTTKATGHGQGPAADAQPSATTSSASAGTGTTTPAPKPSTIDFSDCSGLFNLSAAGIPADRRSKLTFDCGRQNVPVDYAQPNGPTISIEVIRVHYRDQPARIGSLLVNPGGPGGSGVFLAIGLAASLSDECCSTSTSSASTRAASGCHRPIKCETDPAETTRRWHSTRRAHRQPGSPRPSAQAADVRRECDQEVRRGARALQHRPDRPGHGPDPRGGRRREDELPRLLLRHRTRRRVRPPVPDQDPRRGARRRGRPADHRQRDRIQRAADRGLRERVRPVRGRLPPNAPVRSRSATRARRSPRSSKKANTTPIPSSTAARPARRPARTCSTGVLSALYSEQRGPTSAQR